MKIGIDIRTLMDAQYSGVSEYTFSLVSAILKLDTENEYRLFYNTAGSARVPDFAAANAQVVRYNYPNKILNYLLFKNFNWPKIDKMLGVDLFIMPHINFIALSNPKKSILTVHDLSFLRYPEFFSMRKNIWHKMINAPFLIKKFGRIIAVSENTRRDIIDLCGAETEKVNVIYAGIGEQYKVINKDSSDLEQVKKKYNLPEKFILFLGNLEPRKNADGLIAAYSKLRQENNNLSGYKLVLAGAKSWKSKDIFRSYKKSKYKEDIKFLGYVDGEDKPGLYNLASVFVYPSFYEGFGFPPLEAFACGTPVVSSFASSLPEVTGGAALMVDPYNTAEIAEAIKQVLTDESARLDLTIRGLEQAKKFNWHNTARQYLDLFSSLG